MRLKVLFFVSALGAATFTPLLAHAMIPFFGPIIPASAATCAAGWGSLLPVINNIIDFLITIGIVFVAPLVLCYGGFLLVVNPFNPGAKEQAKKVIWHTISGIIIALVAWLLVDMIMAVLTPNGSPFGTRWYQIVTTRDAPVCIDKANTGAVIPTPPPVVVTNPTTTTLTPAQQKAADERRVRTLLGQNPVVFINKNACPLNTAYQDVAGGCTDVGKLLPATIAYAKGIRAACGTGCPAFTITGGSELGHAAGAQSHEAGFKIDLGGSTITQLDNFVCGGACSTSANPLNAGHLTYVGVRSGDGSGRAYQDSCGNIWVRESTHWDVTVSSACTNIKTK